MQLRKTMWMLTALSAMSLVMTGCPEDGGETSLACTSTTDCLETEICHPTAKICVTTCEAGADCPDSAKTCAPVDPNDATSTKVCQCSLDNLCNTDRETADLVCSNLDKVCVPRCESDPDCGAGRTCNTGTGQCEESGTNPGDSCTGEGQGTCTYGQQYCNSNTCTALPAPTCTNYDNFPNKSVLGTTGTIIYSARVVGAAIDNNFCGSGATPKRLRVAVSAYSSTPFPQTKDDLNGFFYVRVNGTTTDGAAAVSSSQGNYTVSGTNRERAEIIVSLCVASDSTTTSTGFYFTSGNFYCYQANYQ